MKKLAELRILAHALSEPPSLHPPESFIPESWHLCCQSVFSAQTSEPPTACLPSGGKKKRSERLPARTPSAAEIWLLPEEESAAFRRVSVIYRPAFASGLLWIPGIFCTEICQT